VQRRYFIASACFAADFAGDRARIEADTADRLRRGEDEHLIYYILQSNSFTALPPVEPAVAVLTVSPSDDVLERMRAFLKALPQRSQDARMQWWQKALPRERRTLEGLMAAWSTAAAFLREKEHGGGLGPVYQRRGHSSDTSLAPGFTVWTALGVIAALDRSARFERVLIVGPGLDFAPRTGYREERPPRSYQPFLTAHAIVDHELGREGLQVIAADVNPRVIDFLRKQPLVPELPPEVGNAEYVNYLRRLRSVRYRLKVVQSNVVTQRVKGTAFDLVVATNVLLYFGEQELALAIANIASMLRPGGYFIHNETRPSLERAARECGMPPIQGRTVEIARGAKSPLLDVAVIHRKDGTGATYSK
jgi:SAM-dependent methyltransferase